jgi:hypothetical protein
MKYLTIFIVFMVIASAAGREVKLPVVHISKREIALKKQIFKNNPRIDKKLASQLSRFIHKYATIFKADANRAISIATQESGLRIVTGKNHNNTRDVGIFQINTRTIKEYNFDAKKLMNDPEYSVKAYFTVMQEKQRICSKLKQESWTCYHSRSPALRKAYKKLVNRYYVIN